MTGILQNRWFLLSAGFACLGMIFFAAVPIIPNYSTIPKWFACGVLLVPLFALRKTWFKLNPWVFWSFSFYLLIVFLNCFRSYNLWDGFATIIPLVLASLLLPLIIRLFGKNPHQLIAFSIIILLSPLLVYTIVDMLVLQAHYNHETTYLYRYSFGHRNQFSHFLTLSIPLILAGWSTIKWKNVLIVLAIALFLTTIILLQNRTSYLIVFGAYPAIGLLILWKRIKSFKIRLVLITLLPFLLVSGIFLIGPSRIKDKLKTSLDVSYGSANERVRIWSNSLHLSKEQPFIGHGTGDWKIEILKTPLRFTQAEENTVFYQRAHNEFIQTLVEHGILGELFLLAVFLSIFILLLKRWDWSLKNALPLAVFFGFFIVCFFSFPFERIELILLFLLSIFPAVRIQDRRFEKVALLKVLTLPLVIIVCAFSVFKGYNEKLLLDYQKDGRIVHLNKTAFWFYTLDATSTPIKWYAGNYYFTHGKYKKALDNYLLAEKRNPYHVHVLNNIASSYYAIGDEANALVYFDKALEINPLFTEALINKAALLFNGHDIDGALLAILSVVHEWETPNYRAIFLAIAKAKCYWLMDLHDDPPFERFLTEALMDDDLLYYISVLSRKSGASYEDELRKYCAEQYLPYVNV